MHLPSELWRGTESPRRCSYLPAERAAIECRVFAELAPEQLEALLERGWRRFGVEVFRPACPSCRACRPIRVDVNRFQPSKSQRRTMRRNAGIQVSIGPPSITQTHIDLYNRWHADMTQRRNWNPQVTTPESYARSFLMGSFPSLHEMQYRKGEKLVGVGLVDVLPHALSSAYFFHDPDWRPQGPGTFSALCEIGLARTQGLQYVYLGYWIADCPSMSYKNRFEPYELLKEFVGDHHPAQWDEA